MCRTHPMDEEHRRVQAGAVEADAAAQRHLLAGEVDAAAAGFADAARRYRASWDLAPPGSFGRLVGLIKAAILAYGPAGAHDEAAFVRDTIGPEPESPVAAYAFALASLAVGDDALARSTSAIMRRTDKPPFQRAGEAIRALVDSDAQAYAAVLTAIVADFESRDEHLTGVEIADTAIVLERLAGPRGLAVRPQSGLIA